MYHDIKGRLAKLLATENLVVEHKNCETAQFNVETRVLTLPIWKISSNDVYDALVAHEVGHALYTPMQEWFLEPEYQSVPHSFVNIIEDVRIEKLMKRRYEGLAKTFYRGYGQLHEDNFFEINKPIEDFSFPDRINLYTKIGPFLCVEFDDEEQELVDAIEKAETFKEVLDLAKELAEFCQTKKQKKIADAPSVEGNDNRPSEFPPTQNPAAEQSDTEDEQEGDTPAAEQSDPEFDIDAPPSDGQGGGDHHDVDEFSTETVESLDEKLKDLVDSGAAESVYLELPKVILDEVVVSTDVIRNLLKDHWTEEQIKREEYLKSIDPRYLDQMKTSNFDQIKLDFKKFKKDAQKEVNYLVKEFECKKSASAYARSTTSKTGMLDCTKLHTYKFNEDLFKKISVTPDGKNHGLIFILDWSGSMSEVLLDTCKQLLKLIWFCKKVGIPFEVYGFTNEFNRQWNTDDYYSSHKGTLTHERVNNTIDISDDFGLLNFLSSSSKNIDEDILNLFIMSGYYAAWRCSDFSLPRGLSLSGTPLNEAIICLNQIIPHFKSTSGVEKTNVVVLTDGEASQLRRNNLIRRQWEDEPYMGHASINSNCYLRNRNTGSVTRFSYSWSDFTKLLLEDIKQSFPEINLIGFRIIPSREVGNFIRHYTAGNDSWTDQEKKKAEFKKNKSFFLEGTGYAKYFALSSTSINQEYDFDEETNSEMNKTQIKRAFVKSCSTKRNNKKILNEFINLVA